MIIIIIESLYCSVHILFNSTMGITGQFLSGGGGEGLECIALKMNSIFFNKNCYQYTHKKRSILYFPRPTEYKKKFTYNYDMILFDYGEGISVNHNRLPNSISLSSISSLHRLHHALLH